MITKIEILHSFPYGVEYTKESKDVKLEPCPECKRVPSLSDKENSIIGEILSLNHDNVMRLSRDDIKLGCLIISLEDKFKIALDDSNIYVGK